MGIRRSGSPSTHPRLKPQANVDQVASLLPVALNVSLRLPFARNLWKFSADSRKAGENIILLSSFIFGSARLWEATDHDIWIVSELASLAFLSIIYLMWTHLSYFSMPKVNRVPKKVTRGHSRSASPRIDNRDGSRRPALPSLPPRTDDFGYIWMTVPKNYRDSSDDGVLTGLLLGPLIAIAFFYTSLLSYSSDITHTNPMPSWWLIEPPAVLGNPPGGLTATQALVLSRRTMIQQSTFCSFVLLAHLTASRMIEARYRAVVSTPEGERGSVPRKEARRARLYFQFTIFVTLAALIIRALFEFAEIHVWRDLSYVDLCTSSVVFQLGLYAAARTAHHGLTLGELGLVVYGATLCFMEAFHLTIAHRWPGSTPYIATFRAPSPLLIFQLALVPGSILIGFLLSPLLFLSRHIAQRPLRKLRFPEEKEFHRRALAAGFYLGAALITGGLIGMWTRWCLGNRDPWLWVIFWMLEGKTKWSRPILLAYWTLLVCLSVAGWNRRLSRGRKFKHMSMLAPIPGVFDASSVAAPDSSSRNNEFSVSALSPNSLVLNFPGLPSLAQSANISAAEFLDAAEQRIPAMGLNARRKFFHALMVVMLLPGIAFDAAFTHLSTSVAFALFIFMEYIRYFALYPFGAAVHIFLTEFTDHKDGGTAILSHFYLLTGCAGSLWLEGPSRLLEFTGLLALGVGDALASIAGRQWGQHRWSPTSSKTLEGSLAFVVSIVACALFLQALGIVEKFSIVRYTISVCFAAALEALSVQNDNLTIPLFLWSLLVLARV